MCGWKTQMQLLAEKVITGSFPEKRVNVSTYVNSKCGLLKAWRNAATKANVTTWLEHEIDNICMQFPFNEHPRQGIALAGMEAASHSHQEPRWTLDDHPNSISISQENNQLDSLKTWVIGIPQAPKGKSTRRMSHSHTVWPLDQLLVRHGWVARPSSKTARGHQQPPPSHLNRGSAKAWGREALNPCSGS